MAGKFHGCQAEIKKHQPLARFVNCGAHVTQLVVCKAFQEAIVIRDALDHIHKLVGSVVEWLKRRVRDQHGLGSKPNRAILLCPWKRHFTTLSSA